MRFLAVAIILVASMIGALMVLPVCPSTKRTPPEKVAECVLVAMAIGAATGGGIAAIPVGIVWLAGRPKRQ
jgi:hypothetical protein